MIFCVYLFVLLSVQLISEISTVAGEVVSKLLSVNTGKNKLVIKGPQLFSFTLFRIPLRQYFSLSQKKAYQRKYEMYFKNINITFFLLSVTFMVKHFFYR